MANNKTNKSASAKVVHRKPTLKQRAFAREYINNGGNASAAVRAVYDVSNDNSAGSVASENLKKPAVLALLNSAEAEAEAVVLEVMRSKTAENKDRIASAKLLLAYTRGNPVSRNENINVNVSLEDILAS